MRRAFLPIRFVARLVHFTWLVLAALRDAYSSRDLSSTFQQAGVSLPRSASPSLWVHGEGLGEFLAAEPLLRQLRASCAGHRLLLTASSAETRQWLKRRHPEAIVLPMPWDVALTVSAWFKRLDPRLLILLDFADGFCPAALIRARRRGVAVAVVNGRELRPPRPMRYALADLLGLTHSVEAFVDCFCVQDEGVRTRLLARDIPAERIVVTGSLKFDRERSPREERVLSLVRQRLGASESTPILVVACLHEEEEHCVLALYQRLRHAIRDLRLVLAPMKLGRTPGLPRSLNRIGLSNGRLSVPDSTEVEVFLVDTHGDLPALLELASVVLLGGSLTPAGAGHSPLEAALQGKPVVVGPHTPSQAEVMRSFRDADAIRQVKIEQLEETLFAVITSPARQRQMGEAARAVVARHRGATARTLAALTPLLPAPPSYQTPARWWKRPLLAAASSLAGQSLLRRCVRHLDTWEQLRQHLGAPATIACLGNGPSSEDLTVLHEACLFRVNWRWIARGLHARPAVAFTGDHRTFDHCREAILGFRTIEEEIRILARALTRPANWGRTCFTLERLGSFLTTTTWPARPTNGAAMVAAAVALQPKRLILAGIDLFRHRAGAYPDSPETPNAYAKMHDREVELAILRRALDAFAGEVIVLGEPLREALAA